jgi:3-oxoadipate enol-lactonase/4-carboxymuconolactone decarboxylase
LPFVIVDNTRLYYRLEGRSGQPTLVLSHSVGTDHGMWAAQVEDLLPHFQILRYDTRGHGASDAPSGEYSLEMLARDVLGITRALGIDTFAFCGLSMGGAVGQWLAIHAPEKLTALILANTSPQFGPRSNWDERIKRVSEGGMEAVISVVMGRFFSAETLAANGPEVNAIRSVFLGTSPAGYIGCCVALRDADNNASLRKINVPTLVIAGDRDVSTPWQGHGEVLAREIPRARAVRLPAAHLSNLERPRSFSAALLEFLLPPAASDPLDAGFKVRRAVLGDAHVDRSMAAANDLTRDFQTLITRYAWGTIWTRPGLSHRVRRLLALAIAASTGRVEEFRLHVRTGLEHELEPCDLKEVLMQTAIYAGVPAANTGFHIAAEEVEKLRASSGAKNTPAK